MIQIVERNARYCVIHAERSESFACRVRATLCAFQAAQNLAARIRQSVVIDVPESFGDPITVTA